MRLLGCESPHRSCGRSQTLSVFAEQRRFGALNIDLQDINQRSRTLLQKSRHVQSFCIGRFIWLDSTNWRRPLFPVTKGAADQLEVARSAPRGSFNQARKVAVRSEVLCIQRRVLGSPVRQPAHAHRVMHSGRRCWHSRHWLPDR